MMKRLSILIMLSSSLFLSGCSAQENQKTEYIKASNIKKEIIPVDGMTCLGCEISLEKAILQEDGIAKVKASHTDKHVVIEYDKTKTDTSTLIKAIKNSGYTTKE